MSAHISTAAPCVQGLNDILSFPPGGNPDLVTLLGALEFARAELADIARTGAKIGGRKAAHARDRLANIIERTRQQSSAVPSRAGNEALWRLREAIELACFELRHVLQNVNAAIEAIDEALVRTQGARQ